MSRRAGPCLPPTAAMRPPLTATSPVKAALPVPSTMLPPRMTMSCMGAAPGQPIRDDAPTPGGAQRPAPQMCYVCGLILGSRGARQRDDRMKKLAFLLAVICAAVAVMYVVLPGGALPAF